MTSSDQASSDDGRELSGAQKARFKLEFFNISKSRSPYFIADYPKGFPKPSHKYLNPNLTITIFHANDLTGTQPFDKDAW